MAKINVTTDEGELVIELKDKDIGNLDKAVASAQLLLEIKDAVETARWMDKKAKQKQQ